jgi:hypothetical protein
MPDFLINATGSGDITLIAAPPGRSFIRVHHYHLTSDRPTTVKLYSGPDSSTGTLKDGTFATNVSGGGISTPEYSAGIFDCAVGQALVLNNSALSNVLGAGQYSVFTGPS